MKLKVLVVCKLADNTVKENVLLPLLASNMIEKIYVLRDTAAEIFDNRVVYITGDSKTTAKSRHVGRFIRGIKICRKNNIDLIIGVLDTPHGFIGRTIGFVTHTPYVHMTIAGHREFWINGPVAEKLKFWMFGSGAAITVTGNMTRQYLINNGVKNEKIFILPNLPDEAIAKVQPKEEKRYDIVSFSRIDANKNLELLILALEILKRKGLSPRVAVAGDGNRLTYVKQLAVEKQVDGMIYFLGFVKGFEPKVQLLTASSIFVSTSKGEGFPVSLIEAMNCGCVPVVTNVGDISDVVSNGRNGFIFDDFNDPVIFANYLEQLLQNQDMIKEMSAEAMKIRETISVTENGKIWNRVFNFIGK